MNRRDFSKILGATAIAPAACAQTNAQQTRPGVSWSLAAHVAECCGCEIPCPCNFGLPTTARCDGNRLIEIYEGNIGGADLAGGRFLVTFEMGKWTRLYIDDSLNADTAAALDEVLPLAFGGFVRPARSIDRVPLQVERTAERIRFSAPASEVEMKPLRGLDGGLIKIDGLPSHAFHDYIQYESVRHIHNGADRQWSYSGTNGFTSRMIATSDT